jgi:hypothetical protein
MLLAMPITAAEWKPAPGPLATRWAKDVSPENVHPEYPRPQMVRQIWLNLNGLWDYAITAKDAGKPEKWDGKILVPFPIESSLSGVGKRVGPDQKLWYRRTFELPDQPAWLDGKTILLHFGAVDWHAAVWINDLKVGEHRGGYDPFHFEVNHVLKSQPVVGKGVNELVVEVFDPTDAGFQPRGKQVANPHGIWYTPVTGIWQTVWLEPVPAIRVGTFQIETDFDNNTVRFMVRPSEERPGIRTRLTVIDQGQTIESLERDGAIDHISTRPNWKHWSPDSPQLYGVKFEILEGKTVRDEVTSYFAMRKISLGKDDEGHLRLMLNNKSLFQFGTLDQGWWPDGLYTGPTDEALKYDIEITKKLGFNTIRKHVKVEPARWYYHCDTLGMLVWQDMPSGDKHARWDPVGTHNGTEMARSAESAENFQAEWKAILDDLRHFPCIVMWVPFNEGWGQFDTVRITHWTKKHDPTRLVNCASGGNDFPVGDVYDIHRYPGPAAPKPDGKRAIVLGEYGGLGLPLEGHTWLAKGNWGYRTFQTKEELQAAYLRLIDQLRPLVAKGLAAAIYTQTTDVEIEVNGLMTYDRQVLKFDAAKLAAAHKKLYLPPPRMVTLVPTSQHEPQVWRYTTEKPAGGWESPAFDDSAWKEGPGGFGEKSTPGSVVRTEWKTADIWLRRGVELPPDKTRSLGLAIHYDEDSEIYLNGILIGKTAGYTTDYTTISIDDEVLKKALAASRSGKHTLAVHCRQTGGGQYIDVGLVEIVEE